MRGCRKNGVPAIFPVCTSRGQQPLPKAGWVSLWAQRTPLSGAIGALQQLNESPLTFGQGFANGCASCGSSGGYSQRPKAARACPVTAANAIECAPNNSRSSLAHDLRWRELHGLFSAHLKSSGLAHLGIEEQSKRPIPVPELCQVSRYHEQCCGCMPHPSHASSSGLLYTDSSMSDTLAHKPPKRCSEVALGPRKVCSTCPIKGCWTSRSSASAALRSSHKPGDDMDPRVRLRRCSTADQDPRRVLRGRGMHEQETTRRPWNQPLGLRLVR